MSVNSVKSAERTMDVLELLAAQERPLAAMTIARRCGMPKSSTYHLLKALRARGFVSYREAERGWEVGERVRQLGASAVTLPEAVAVLDAFDSGASSVEPSELARRAHLHVATVGRILDVLASESLVTVHPDGSCSLGVRLVALSARLGTIEELRLAARQALIDLRDETGETANLLIRDGVHAVYVDQVESRHALRHAGWAGRAVPLEGSAAGAALDAAEAEVQIVSDAVEEGVTAIAGRVPVALDYPAAVGVTGPSARLRGDRLDRARRAVADAIAEVAREFAGARRPAA